jgi:GTPase SAR1 family protein
MLSKIVLLGNRKAGKSICLDYYSNYMLEYNYIPTYECRACRYNDYFIWDLAGEELLKDLNKKYIAGSIGGILFVDASTQIKIIELIRWISEFKLIEPLSKIVLFISKMDISVTDYVTEAITFANKYELEYYPISIKNGLIPKIEEIF